MAEKQEQRSLQAERWEQEKAQLLEHMERLHEEDLRVTAGPWDSLPGRGAAGWPHFLSGSGSFHSAVTTSILLPYETFMWPWRQAG